MLAFSPINGFVRTRNSEKSQKFYEGALGLSFVLENDCVTVFRGGGSMVVAQKVREFIPDRSIVMGWEVQDIRAVVSILRKRGVMFERVADMKQDELGIWRSPE